MHLLIFVHQYHVVDYIEVASVPDNGLKNGKVSEVQNQVIVEQVDSQARVSRIHSPISDESVRRIPISSENIAYQHKAT